MKKSYTIILFTISFSIFLISQVIVDKSNIWASFSLTKSLPERYYNSIFKDIVLGNNLEERSSLSTIKSDIIILNFWASWCMPCRGELSSLVKLREKYGTDELTILSINGDNPEAVSKVQRMIDQFGINFPVITDSNGLYFEKFLVDSLPFSLIYFKGKIIEVIRGKRDFVSKYEIDKFEDLLNSK